MNCKMISIDSSTTKTGYAVFINGLLDSYKLIDTESIKDAEDRFNAMCKSICQILEEQKPHIICIEKTNVERNTNSLRVLSKMLGAIQCWSILHDTEYVELSPSKWRAYAAEGEKYPQKREELKAWSINKVKTKYGVDVDDNVADAILIGQARINQFKKWFGEKGDNNDN